MTDEAYCYHCRRDHPRAEMRLVHTNGRRRWRCRRSLDSVGASPEERDAFGRQVSAMNRRSDRAPLPRCVTELLVPSR